MNVGKCYLVVGFSPAANCAVCDLKAKTYYPCIPTQGLWAKGPIVIWKGF